MFPGLDIIQPVKATLSVRFEQCIFQPGASIVKPVQRLARPCLNGMVKRNCLISYL